MSTRTLRLQAGQIRTYRDPVCEKGADDEDDARDPGHVLDCERLHEDGHGHEDSGAPERGVEAVFGDPDATAPLAAQADSPVGEIARQRGAAP